MRIERGMRIEEVLKERKDLICIREETEECCGEYEGKSENMNRRTLVVCVENGIVTERYTI